MRPRYKNIVFVLLTSLLTTVFPNPGFALTSAPQIAQDKESGYDRSFFKHWIDENRNGCDTRAEVLISEAVVKPKVDKKCKITGGKWLSAYDGKSVTNASQLDVDHLVPLAEAWRSGAWAWTPKQRQDYANDLGDTRALIAVTLTTNRSKSDRDISDWVPKINPCGYVQNWIAIKIRYSLTYDAKEAKSLASYFEVCKFGDIPVQALSGYSYQSQTVQSSPAPTASSSPLSNPTTTPSASPTASPTVSADFQRLSELDKSRCIDQAKKIEGLLTILGSYEKKISDPNIGKFRDKNKIFTNDFPPTRCIIDKFQDGTIKLERLYLTDLENQILELNDLLQAKIQEALEKPTPTPTPTTVASTAPVSPGAFCSPAGATGKSANGTSYTCKTSPTDARNRWRQ
jgi:hypothetical protein